MVDNEGEILTNSTFGYYTTPGISATAERFHEVEAASLIARAES